MELKMNHSFCSDVVTSLFLIPCSCNVLHMFWLRTVTYEYLRNVLVLFVTCSAKGWILSSGSKRTTCNKVLSVHCTCSSFAKSNVLHFFAIFGHLISTSLRMEKAPLLPEVLKEHNIMYSPHSSEDVFNETLLVFSIIQNCSQC